MLRSPFGAGPRAVRREGGVIVSTDFWRERRVFVTGHTGFKGAWLCLWLQLMGATVTGYALAPATHPNLFQAARIGRGMRSIQGDVRDLDHLAQAVREARPEVVLHLAAQPIVRRSYEDPVGTLSTNVLGTVHLLEAVRLSGDVRSLVVVTSILGWTLALLAGWVAITSLPRDDIGGPLGGALMLTLMLFAIALLVGEIVLVGRRSGPATEV